MTSGLDPTPLPTGTVTFLFTDIQGSTRLLHDLGDVRFREVLEHHNRIIREVLAQRNGVEVSTEGDSFFAVFVDPVDAVTAAIDIQRSLAIADNGRPLVKVRCGIHTGMGLLGGDNYTGVDVHKASRVSSAAHGGQTLLSDVTAQLVRERLESGAHLVNLGRFRLEGFTRSEALHQLDADGLDASFPPPTAPRAGSRLPMPLTEFVGRDRELDDGLAALADHRLLTLTGPGGTGKTRLAIELARRLEHEFPDGAVFVSLAVISDPNLVAGTIIEALELAVVGGVDPLEHLLRYLADKRILLLLDNLEQLTQGVPVVGRLLNESPGLKIIATSRTPLRITGEREFPVPPLDVPEDGAPAEKVAASPGVRLFVSRAAAVRPGFEIGPDNLSAVVGITRSLDGLPLAIELAASRVRSLTPELILERLGNQLLSAPASDLPARQQTIVNAIGWSYDLLTPPVRALFEKLSVFSGSFGLTEAELVCAGDEDVLGGLIELVEQSLLRQTETTGEPRFRMLTVIREFGYAALVARGEEQEAVDAHTSVYLNLAERASEEILTSKQEMWLDRLSVEHDNIRAAFDRAIQSGEADVALRLGGAMWRFWQIRGHLAEGQQRLESALNLPGPHSDVCRARALTGLGGILYWKGRPDESTGPYEEALDLYRRVGDEKGIAEATYNASFPVAYAGDLNKAETILEEALELSERLDWRIGVGRAYWGLGDMALFAGDWDRTRELSARAIEEFESLDAPFDLGWAWFMVTNSYVRQDRFEEAGESLRHSFDAFSKVHDLSALVLIYRVLGYVMLRRGERLSAAWIAGASTRIADDTGIGIADSPINQFGDWLDFVAGLTPEEQAQYDRGYEADPGEVAERASAWFD